ncbi:DUF4358 domain-containing protein [Ruminococcus sp. Marseille-P6503]|uniref:DUF4358 domain-containing protein n=1 Tax=Ruminococcus sp. Marseille-P6503 TaxID=2364796 RepID=UPI0013DE19E0|nr:DUF4358 domain-containing protein [Ruminococcus sp. Marseille-P6503]
MKRKLKTIHCILCACVLITVPAGCGSDEGGRQSNASDGKDNVSVREILEKVKDSGARLDASFYFDDSGFEENCSKLYSIEYSQLSDGGILFCESGEYADEITVLKPADGDAENAARLLEKRKEARAEVYEGYSPSEAQKARDAVVFEKNGFAALVITDDAESVAQLIKDKL